MFDLLRVENSARSREANVWPRPLLLPRSVRSEFREDGAESVLNVARVDKADSGNYTCAISPNQRTTVLVHVLDGEYQGVASPPDREAVSMLLNTESPASPRVEHHNNRA